MLAYSQRVEAGPWFTAGRRLLASEVEERLARSRPRGRAEPPYCVYVHVPFCASICGFCALYTRAVAPGEDDLLDEYLDLVVRSIESHPWNSPDRPPTTVHFGGGTPLFLGMPRFARLVRALVSAFGTSPACEWAVETTTSSVSEGTLEQLQALGFQRIHLGIQTLDDDTRARIGRQETGAKALERIRSIEERGIFSSVDLIIGFDGVGTSVVETDLQRLYDAGVRMFSICELRERGKPRLGIKDPAEKLDGTYRIWRKIWEFMDEKGLAPIHLGQFGRTQADNLYFTHPARGEDCVAIGPYSHGSFGDVYYGNCLTPAFYEAVRAGNAPIEQGVEYAEDARVIRALERALLAHRVSEGLIDETLAAYPGDFPEVLDYWLRKELLIESTEGSFVHSLDGSWFVGNMVAEARSMLDPAWQPYRRSA
jgi:oxygen-independent coproporphyrinogen-3 oxidase